MKPSKIQSFASDALERAINVDLNKTEEPRMRTFRDALPDMTQGGLALTQGQAKGELAEMYAEEFDASMTANLVPALEKLEAGIEPEDLNDQDRMALSYGNAIVTILQDEAADCKSEERKMAKGQRTNVIESTIQVEGFKYVRKKLERLCAELGIQKAGTSPPTIQHDRFS